MKDIVAVVKKYFKHPGLYILAVLFTTLQGISEIILPKYMGDIVNRGIITGSLDVVYSIGIRMLVVTGILGISGYASFILINIAVLRFGNELRTSLYDRVTKLSYSSVKRVGSGSVITRLTGDVEKVISIIKVTIDLIYKPLILAIGGFLMIFYINLKFGLIFLAFIIIQIIIIYLFIKKSSPMFMKVQTRIDNINSKLQQVLHGMRLIKSSTTEEVEGQDFEGRNTELYSKNIEVLTVMSSLNPIVMFIMNITIVVIVIMIGYKGADSSTAIGNVMMSITYSEQILMSIMISSNMARTISEMTPSLRRLTELEELELESSGSTVLEGVDTLRLCDVSKEYIDGRLVLSHIDLEINRGDMISIVGSTSGGKSTLSMLIAGLEQATQGSVLLNDIDIAEYTSDSLRRHIALVGSYNCSIYSGTYMDNLTLGRDIPEEQVIRAAKTAEIDDFISSTDYGYESLAYASGNTISGGQRQRLMIARALSAEPDILILDDSTSSLDYATERQIIENIRNNYRDTALIFITERSGSATGFDRSYSLEEGGLV